VTSRACIAGLLAGLVVLVAAEPAATDPPRSVSSYYLGRGDPRLCPSPFCGGVWVRLVNKELAPCGGGGIARRECYVANVDLSRMPISEQARTNLAALVATGRALARGTIVAGRVEGFPELATLLVSEVWPASSSPRTPEGPFRLLRDNRVRCVTTPCFSIHATLLNVGSHANVSRIDLSRTRAPLPEKRCVVPRIGTVGLIATGRIAPDPNAGPAGTGRVFVATQFYSKRNRVQSSRCVP
jgi:hypothetical protein